MSELHKRIRKSSLHTRIMSAEDTIPLLPQPIMREYFERARRECCEMNVGHEPHMLFKVFKMQQSLAEEGTMKIGSWN